MQAQLREANVLNAQRQWEMATTRGGPGVLPLQDLGCVDPPREWASACQPFSADVVQGNRGMPEHVPMPAQGRIDDHRAADTVPLNAAHPEHTAEVASDVLAVGYGMGHDDRSDVCSVGDDVFPTFGLARAIASKIQL